MDVITIHASKGAIGLFHEHGLTLIPARVSNNMLSKVWDEISSFNWSLGMGQ